MSSQRSAEGSRCRVAVVGASGYTGAELLRLILRHPHLELTGIYGHRSAGKPIETVLPSLAGVLDMSVQSFDAQHIRQHSEVVFCALPHGASAARVAELYDDKLCILDLSADFRLPAELYAQWYAEHPCPELIAHAVYGLVELSRERLATAKLIAVPGCYPTASILALAPLLQAGCLKSTGRIIIDAKSGVSGAGRELSLATQFGEIAEGMHAYKVGGVHRHIGEIEHALNQLSEQAVHISFTPHLVPMVRGMLVNAYVELDEGGQEPTELARAMYRDSPCVHVLEPGSCPDTRAVRAANRALLSYAQDPRTGICLAQAAIDNLTKGASGQAIQCLNLRLGLDEMCGLDSAPLWP